MTCAPPPGLLELSPVERGVVSIFGVASRFFVAMSNKGKLYGSVSTAGAGRVPAGERGREYLTRSRWRELRAGPPGSACPPLPSPRPCALEPRLRPGSA